MRIGSNGFLNAIAALKEEMEREIEALVAGDIAYVADRSEEKAKRVARICDDRAGLEAALACPVGGPPLHEALRMLGETAKRNAKAVTQVRSTLATLGERIAALAGDPGAGPTYGQTGAAIVRENTGKSLSKSL